MTDILDQRSTATGPSVDPLMRQWREIGASYARNHRALITGFEEFGVQGQWFEVLIALLQAPKQRMAMSKLAVSVTMTSGGLTKLVDRLEQAGFAERQSDPKDRRIVHAALTESGVQAAQSSVGSYSRALVQAVNGSVTTEEMTRTAELMARLHPVADADPTPA